MYQTSLVILHVWWSLWVRLSTLSLRWGHAQIISIHSSLGRTLTFVSVTTTSLATLHLFPSPDFRVAVSEIHWQQNLWAVDQNRIIQAAWPHRCPPGYTQHLASMEQSCEINYCVKAGSLDKKGLPPFQKYPSLNPNTLNVTYIISAKGDLWEKDNRTNEWWIVTKVEGMEFTGDMDSSGVASDTAHDSNSVATMALIISTTVLLGLVTAGFMYVIYHRYKKYKIRSYENIEETNN